MYKLFKMLCMHTIEFCFVCSTCLYIFMMVFIGEKTMKYRMVDSLKKDMDFSQTWEFQRKRDYLQ